LYMNTHYSETKDTYNFGPQEQDHLTVEALINIAKSIFGKGEYEVLEHTQLHEAGILKLNIELAMQQLNWQPQYTAHIAIEKTIQWYLTTDDKRKFTQQQIKQYLQSLNAF
jgi:CDP-glucose 4,6-dehydratase